MKKVAILTCAHIKSYIFDDDILLQELERVENYAFSTVVWNDESIDWRQFDVAVIRTTWDYTEHIQDFYHCLEKIEQAGCLLLNPLSVIKENTHKSYLKRVKAAGVSTVPSIFLSDETKKSFAQWLERSQETTYVLKPVVGASAEGIRVLEKKQMVSLLDELDDLEHWFVQPFLEDIYQGEISSFFFNGVYSHSIKKVPKNGDFRVQEEYGGDTTDYHLSEHELSFCRKVVERCTDDLLYVRVDFVKRRDEFMLMELELVEPSMYFRHNSDAAPNFRKALLERLEQELKS